MEKSVNSQAPDKSRDTDIVDQPYKGTSATISSFGYSFIDFKIALLASLATGIATAALFPKQATAFLDIWKKTASTWKTESNPIKKGTGWAMDVWAGTGGWFEKHFPFHDRISGWMGKDRWAPSSAVGGMLMAFSFIGTILTGANRGIHTAHAGRDQFNHAKSEIKDLRLENEKLRDRNAELKVAHDTGDQQAEAPAATSETQAPARRDIPDTLIQQTAEPITEKALAQALENEAARTV